MSKDVHQQPMETSTMALEEKRQELPAADIKPSPSTNSDEAVANDAADTSSTHKNEKHGDEGLRFGATDGAEGEMYDRARVKQEPKGWALLSMSFRALGIVYGDIGTSPLYVLNGIFPTDGPLPPEDDVIGIISCIIWIFTIVVIVQYAFIVLSFGTREGEGGTFALYQGLFPREQVDEDDSGARTRALTFVSTKSIHSARSDRRDSLLRYSWIKPALLALALFGSALTLADGILTPAVSVISAAEGLAVVDASLTRGDIDGISIAILLILVAVQSLGVKKLGIIFSPAVLLWMVFLAVTGIINVTTYPGILRAFDPSRAILYFVRTGNYDALAGVLLSITGVEALFASIGQLSVRAIRLPLIFVVYPSLMLAYLGQGAKLIDRPADVLPNIFYLSVPGGQSSAAYWIGFVLGLLATIIASQALLSASFSIVAQLSHMRSLPPIRQIHTDDNDMGPVYVPVANIALAIGIVVAVAAFESSARLLNAYGFSVSTVMLVTCVEVALQTYFVKKKPWFIAALFLLFFGFVDGLLWGASLKKIPHGAWFSFAIGLVLWMFMMFYSWASALVSEFDTANRIPLSALLRGAPTARTSSTSTSNRDEDDEDAQEDALHAQAHDVDADLLLNSLDGSKKLMRRMPVAAVFWKVSGGSGVPHAFAHFLSKYPAAPQIIVFLSLRVLAVPRIPRSHRILVNKTRRYAGFYGVTLRIGYLDDMELKDFGTDLLAQILALEKSIGPERSSLPALRRQRRERIQQPQRLGQLHDTEEQEDRARDRVDAETEFQHRLEAIRAAGEGPVTHVYPSYYVLARPLSGSLRRRPANSISSTTMTSDGFGTPTPEKTDHQADPDTSNLSLGKTKKVGRLVPVLRAVPITAVDYVRAFLLEEVFRRVKSVFAEEDGPFEAREEIVRIQVSAAV
ncbi:hypothetical protein CF327_g381 [Tilletia walkeri]|nr:hypothetical protein CF327_g381 [Tilletia walkeri]